VDWEAKRAEAVQLAIEAGFSAADAEALAAACRPALRLVPVSGSDVPVGASKIGGLPDLPLDVRWPTGQFGPMTLCAQLRLADTSELAGVEGWTPGDSLLCFFADLDSETAEAVGGRVIAVPREDAARREAPADLPPAYVFIEEARLDLLPVLTPPMSFDSGPELEHDLDADDWKAWEWFYESLGCGRPVITAGHHQLLGHAWQVGDLDPVWMGGVRLASADEDPDEEDGPFRLLAQFTNDNAANVEIADGGAIYFVGRSTDFATGSFDEVVVIMVSH
jgi:Domain of unknown function (DUF1963)